jgi:hypothetical protein
MKNNQPEHDNQVALFEWAEKQSQTIPELGLMFAIPNGGKRHINVAKAMKQEGVKKGVPDIFLAFPHKGMAGFFIELKSKKGRVSPEQKNWIKKLNEAGYRVDVHYSWESAKDAILEYLK